MTLAAIPPDWLYATPKLELCWVGSREQSPMLVMEGRKFYRLNPAIYARLIMAGDVLEEHIRRGEAAESDGVEYVRQMTVVGEFVTCCLPRDQVEAALATERNQRKSAA